MKIAVETPGNGVYAQLNGKLVDLNRAMAPWTGNPFTVSARDESGNLIGGVRGVVNMGLVEVRGLWVDPTHRGGGTGARLMATLEQHAQSLGATRAALFTYDWQARGFYEKLRYRVFGTLEFPHGATRFYMQKDLDGSN